MRTTVTLDDEVAVAVEQLRRESGVGVSAALNEIAKRGLAASPKRERFVQQTHPMGLKINVDNVAEALEHLDRLDAEAARDEAAAEGREPDG